MTNLEKYKTAEERIKAFDQYCDTHDCNECQFRVGCEGHLSAFKWLELEAEEYKRSFCFYCKHQSVEIVERSNGYMARCACCDYQSRAYDSKEEAYLTHNRVADKCMLGEMRKFQKKMERKAVKESEVKV